MSEATISLPNQDQSLAVLGIRDRHLQQVRNALGIKAIARNGAIHLEGPDEQVDRASRVFAQLQKIVEQQGSLTPTEVQGVLDSLERGGALIGQESIEVPSTSKRVRPRTDGQVRYVRAIRDHDLSFCTGPAGTGKTYLAVAMAVNMLRSNAIKKIVLVRPAVEAGERLGFLPGDLQAKVNPYLRPLLDALHDMMDHDSVKRYMDHDMIEIAPLAYMRGRTLNHSIIILDEGQNCTVPQMKMFLTRMGQGSKIIVTGDVTQVDLPPETRSGLSDAVRRLRGIRGVAVVQLDRSDIVRHPLVQEIVQAYGDEERRHARPRS